MIGEKYYNQNELITIYKEYSNTIKVKTLSGEFKFIKKEELRKNYTRLIPMGVITIFYIDDDYTMTDKGTGMPMPIRFKDIVFIFDPELDNIMWDHSENCSPTLIKTSIYDCVCVEDMDEYKCMTSIDEGWIVSEEIHLLNQFKKYCYTEVAVYLDTSIDIFLDLLQENKKIFDDVVVETVGILQEKLGVLSEDASERYSSLKDIIEFLGFYNMIEYTMDIIEEDLGVPKNLGDDYGLVVFSRDVLESLVVRIGDQMSNILIIKYWYDFNLNRVEMEHALLRDRKSGELFILLYNTEAIAQPAIDKAFSREEQSKIYNLMTSK